MSHESADWQNLKSDWQASSPLETIAMGALRGSLRWRIWASRAWFALEVLSFLFLGLVMLLNLLHGQVARGVGLGVVVALCLAASIWARRGRQIGSLDSIPGMIELTLSRARKSLRIVYATYAVIGVTLIAAVADADWPRGDDDVLIARLIKLAVCAAATLVYHLYVRARVGRFESIRRAFKERQE